MSGLKDYHPVALKPIMIKCFKQLVRDHIISRLPFTLSLTANIRQVQFWLETSLSPSMESLWIQSGAHKFLQLHITFDVTWNLNSCSLVKRVLPLPVTDEKSKRPHHIPQRHHRECTNQLNLCLVQLPLCFRSKGVAEW